MKIEIRLSELEKRKRLKSGAIVLFVNEDGTATYRTPKIEQQTYNTEEEALAEIHKRYDDPSVVIIGYEGKP